MLEINLHPFPTLQTERLVLREISHADDAEIIALRQDARLVPYFDNPTLLGTEEIIIRVQRMIDMQKNNTGISWGITLKTNPTLIGTIGFWRIDKENHRGEVGYMLNADYHRRGIMHEAMQAAIGFGFKHIKLHSIVANIYPGNVASVQLVEKCGFVREAHFKENHYNHGRFLDTYSYSLINPFE
jgi:[ribosomal protein S5]-alanine N-acetyltransferase